MRKNIRSLTLTALKKVLLIPKNNGSNNHKIGFMKLLTRSINMIYSIWRYTYTTGNTKRRESILSNTPP